MAKPGTSLWENGLIWFGAGVSIAEILTGTYFASLGFSKGMAAILVGHVIGCLLLFFAGLIGARTRKSAMETVKMSFGQRGGLLFCVLNMLQLLGWTAIMIYDGALAADGIWPVGSWFWCLVIGGLIALWLLVGIRNLRKLNAAAMAALFLMSLALCWVVVRQGGGFHPVGEALSFGGAVELAVAMPLSWLPLISDYTREAARPVAATGVSALVYGLVSCWMYAIGMGAALLTGESDIAQIMVKAGLGATGLLILILSTVTTTFLDANSAGVSSESLPGSWRGRHVALAVTALGTVGAALYPMDNITGFLYLIGSVFAPMIAIQIADMLCWNRKGEVAFDWPHLAVWAVGFVLYRLLMGIDLPLGNTLPDMGITFVLCILVNQFVSARRRARAAVD